MLSYRVKETGATDLGGDDTVVKLAAAVEAQGYTCFIGESALQGGELWAKKIQEAVKARLCYVTLV